MSNLEYGHVDVNSSYDVCLYVDGIFEDTLLGDATYEEALSYAKEALQDRDLDEHARVVIKGVETVLTAKEQPKIIEQKDYE